MTENLPSFYIPATGHRFHHRQVGNERNDGNRPFILYPSELPYDGKPIFWSKNVHKQLREWSDAAHGTGTTTAITESGSQLSSPNGASKTVKTGGVTRRIEKDLAGPIFPSIPAAAR
jgi:hypothetical protein